MEQNATYILQRGYKVLLLLVKNETIIEWKAGPSEQFHIWLKLNIDFPLDY